jgi:hypothetical protein
MAEKRQLLLGFEVDPKSSVTGTDTVFASMSDSIVSAIFDSW